MLRNITVLTATLLAVSACERNDRSLEDRPDPAGAGIGHEMEMQETNVAVRLREWAVDLSHTSVPAGSITFHIVNDGSVEHDFELEGPDGEHHTVAGIRPGAVSEITTALPPGSYTIFCSREEEGVDHLDAGMRATFLVEEEAEDQDEG